MLGMIAATAVIAAITVVGLKWPLLTIGALLAGLGLLWLITVQADRVAGYAVVFHVGALVAVPALALGISQASGVFGAILGVDVIAWLRNRRAATAHPGQRWLLLLLAFIAMVTLLFSNTEGAVGWAMIAAAMLPAYLLVEQCNPAERRIVMRALILLALLQAVIAVAEFMVLEAPLWGYSAYDEFGDPIPSVSGVLPPHERSQGTMAHALPMSFLLVVGLALLLRRDLGFRNVSRWFGCALLVVGCLFAGSRSGLIVCALLLVFYAGWMTSPGRRAAGWVLTTVGVAWLWMTGFFLTDAITRLTESGSVYHRAELLDVIPRLFLQQSFPSVVFGNGWGASDDLFAAGLLQRTGFTVVDNQLVSVMVAGGLVGTLLFGLFLVKTFQASSPRMQPALLAGLSMFVIFDVLGWHATAAIFATVAALSVSEPAGQRVQSADGVTTSQPLASM